MKTAVKNEMTTLGITLLELYLDVMEAITSESRTTIIDKILELAEDEYESKESLIELAKKELMELKETLHEVYSYYEQETINNEN